MPTSWTDHPATSTTPAKALHINEVRAAINTALGFTPNWTDGATVSNTIPIRAKHFTEIKDAIQTLWRDRGLGLIPNWTSGQEPDGPSIVSTHTGTPIRASDINDVRRWFNYYETWGDLRGVHWFKSGINDFPHVGWNVETVIALQRFDPQTQEWVYNESAVTGTGGALERCTAARNYGLVNIVRMDWRPGLAVPTGSGDYGAWKNNFNTAVNSLIDVATIFIAGNEPNVEGSISAADYASAFDYLYSYKVQYTHYLAAGPSVWSYLDLDWLSSMAADLDATDGFALHSYGTPYMQWAQSCSAMCDNPTQSCSFDCADPPPDPTIPGDASFQRFRDYLAQISTSQWPNVQIYLTETNTHGFGSATSNDNQPKDNYPTGWMQNAYAAVHGYNTNRGQNDPRVLTLCWFVDDDTGNLDWEGYALSNTQIGNLGNARSDFISSTTSTGL